MVGKARSGKSRAIEQKKTAQKRSGSGGRGSRRGPWEAQPRTADGRFAPFPRKHSRAAKKLAAEGRPKRFPGAWILGDNAEPADIRFRKALFERTVDIRCKGEQRRKVEDAVARNFSAMDIATFDDHGRPVVRPFSKAEESDRRYGKGNYRRKTKNDKGKVDGPEIALRKNASEYTITHEFVHHERTVDWRRFGFSKTAYPIDRKGTYHTNTKTIEDIRKVNVAEESATTAETAMRCGKAQKSYPFSYYKNLEDQVKKDVAAHPEKEESIKKKYGVDSLNGLSRKMYERDREMLRNVAGADEGEPVTGYNAIKTINGNFKKTNISDLKMGDETARSIFERIKSLRRKRRYDYLDE
ncbi:MAG: hypothetical protein A3Q59_07725 [Methanomethylophilus alvi]|nr:MAG: hypothetical protein A3Q59_07725 [Methanomethylophilus alvi]